MKYLAILFVLFATQSVAQKVDRKERLNPNEALLKQYGYLFERSFKYAHDHKNLWPAIQTFIDSNKEYNFRKYSILEPIILHPLVLSNNEKRLLVMILSREKDLSGARVEYINF